ncbi:MAG: DNA (cytosine-5-)-methyltransferase, partial [Candidatus Woesearchaeota archaeon]
GLLHIDNGQVMQTILRELQRAGYKVFWKVLNSCNFGVPHRRERVFFVGIRQDLVSTDFEFSFPEPRQSRSLSEFLIDEDEEFEINEKDSNYLKRYLQNKYNKGNFTLGDLLSKEFLIIDIRQTKIRLYENAVPTLRAKRQGILYVRNSKLRKLSGFEALLLQGFDRTLAEKVKGKIKNTTLLQQAGNALTANIVEALGSELLRIYPPRQNTPLA